MKITVVGIGYVGLSNAVLFSQKNEVIALDVVEEKAKLINQRISPLIDSDITNYLKEKELKLTATTKKEVAYQNADFVLICTPTDYNTETNYFDTSSVEKTIEDTLSYNSKCTIIIKSTIPIGFTQQMRKKFNYEKIIFSPEFLREGKALYDNLYPSRIIIGDFSSEAKLFSNLLLENSLKQDVKVLFVNSSEAEAIKLFSNTYLALRVSYFNELDTFAELNGFNTKQIIDGVSLDPRIGDYYNNPSFGYGGYCLPKDTKQLKANFKNIPNNLINAIVDSNNTRKAHIVNMILKNNPKVVGIYKLTMKSESDNFRSSAVLTIIELLKERNIDVIVYEPLLNVNNADYNFNIVENFNEFVKTSDVIVTNRLHDELKYFEEKIYTRDLFTRD